MGKPRSIRSRAPTREPRWRSASFVGDRRGATAVEYGLIAFLISIAIVGSLTAMGSPVTKLFNVVLGGVSKLN